jgi:zinc transport system permease protein
VLLALIVNLSLPAVGILLINALLVVPAATAANLSRNLRQMFWLSILLGLLAGVGGLWASNAMRLPIGRDESIELGPAGTIVVISVVLFFASVLGRAAGGAGRRRSLAEAGMDGENAVIAEPAPGRPA